MIFIYILEVDIQAQNIILIIFSTEKFEMTEF